MPVCAIARQQPDGTIVLALDPLNTNPSSCAYVVSTGTESILGELASMTMNDAALISSAIALLWAGAWGIRLLARYLLSIGETYEIDS